MVPYLAAIILLNLLSVIGWLGCIVINDKQHTSYFSLGNILYCYSYVDLTYRNIDQYITHQYLTQDLMQITLKISVMQFAAICWFIGSYYYQKRKNKKNGYFSNN